MKKVSKGTCLGSIRGKIVLIRWNNIDQADLMAMGQLVGKLDELNTIERQVAHTSVTATRSCAGCIM